MNRNFKFDHDLGQVDSVNKHGSLLQVVQVLADMNLVIKKAYISSDGGWFMDGVYEFLYTMSFSEFTSPSQLLPLFLKPAPCFDFLFVFFFYSVLYVTDYHGSKIKDREVINYIKEVHFLFQLISCISIKNDGQTNSWHKLARPR